MLYSPLKRLRKDPHIFSKILLFCLFAHCMVLALLLSKSSMHAPKRVAQISFMPRSLGSGVKFKGSSQKTSHAHKAKQAALPTQKSNPPSTHAPGVNKAVVNGSKATQQVAQIVEPVVVKQKAPVKQVQKTVAKAKDIEHKKELTSAKKAVTPVAEPHPTIPSGATSKLVLPEIPPKAAHESKKNEAKLPEIIQEKPQSPLKKVELKKEEIKAPELAAELLKEPEQAATKAEIPQKIETTVAKEMSIQKTNQLVVPEPELQATALGYASVQLADENDIPAWFKLVRDTIALQILEYKIFKDIEADFTYTALVTINIQGKPSISQESGCAIPVISASIKKIYLEYQYPKTMWNKIWPIHIEKQKITQQ